MQGTLIWHANGFFRLHLPINAGMASDPQCDLFVSHRSLTLRPTPPVRTQSLNPECELP